MASGAGEARTRAPETTRLASGAHRVSWESEARVREARARLDAELAALPSLGSPGLRALLRLDHYAVETGAAGAPDLPDSRERISPGALVALLRRAEAAHDTSLAQDLFVSLLERSEASNRCWAARVVAHTPSLRVALPVRASVREDLRQELTLSLWQRLAHEHDPAWELYFSRALAFAQRRVARVYMEHNGYWPASGASLHPERLPALLLSRLAPYGEDGAIPASEPALDDGALTLADLADLRELVGRLPERERLAVVMRFWLGAREHEVGSALGVTSRTVRNLLTRAYARLRRGYTGQDGEGTDEGTDAMAIPAAEGIAGNPWAR